MCKSWPPPCGQTRKDRWTRGTSLQLVGSAPSSRQGGRWRLLHPWPILLAEEQKQLRAGQRRKGGEPLAQGEEHQGLACIPHSIKQMPWQEHAVEVTLPAWYYTFGLLPTGPSRDLAAGITARAWAPRVRLFSRLDFVSELGSAWVKTHEQRLYKGTWAGMMGNAWWTINTKRCRTLTQRSSEALTVTLHFVSSSFSAGALLWPSGVNVIFLLIFLFTNLNT